MPEYVYLVKADRAVQWSPQLPLNGKNALQANETLRLRRHEKRHEYSRWFDDLINITKNHAKYESGGKWKELERRGGPALEGKVERGGLVDGELVGRRARGRLVGLVELVGERVQSSSVSA